MTDLERFLLLLSGLMLADIVLTLVAVGYMDATELNPLCERWRGLNAFLLIKAVLSAAGVVGLFYIGRKIPKAAKIGAVLVAVLCVLYGVAVVGGVVGMVLEVI